MADMKEIFDRLNEVFQDVFDDETITVGPKTTAKDIDDWENSELFAAENLAVMKVIKEETGTVIDDARWNPNGGALGLGHPGAASGAQMLMFALMQLEKTGGRYASVSAACGGGLGVTVLLENLKV